MWTELTQLNGEKSLINLDNVMFVRKNKHDSTSVLLMRNGEPLGVLESRNDVKRVLMRKKAFYPCTT